MLALLLLGCAAGTIRWSDDSDTLRTALYREDPDGSGLVILLSNSSFTCDLPSFEDPEQQTEALYELTTAACRENARHVVIDLVRAKGSWEGRYPGGDGVPGATAAYYGIEEAGVEEFEGLLRTYVTLEETAFPNLGPGGEVVIDKHDDILKGTFDFPEAPVSGRFRADRCELDASLFTLLQTSPVAGCP